MQWTGTGSTEVELFQSDLSSEVEVPFIVLGWWVKMGSFVLKRPHGDPRRF